MKSLQAEKHSDQKGGKDMISCIINGKKRTFDVSPTMRLRDMQVLNGNLAVRDSDDAEGFCGSDTVLLDGTPVWWKAARFVLRTVWAIH